MNKFLYKRAYWLYFILSNIRMSYYLNIGNKKEAKKIITEHFKWK